MGARKRSAKMATRLRRHHKRDGQLPQVRKTGNRRFWPMKTGTIRLEELKAQRDQLWAEAAYLEAQGEPIHANREMSQALKLVQAKREEHDEWVSILDDELKGVKATTLANAASKLNIFPSDFDTAIQKRLRDVMRKLGFEIADRTVKGRRMWERQEP